MTDHNSHNCLSRRLKWPTKSQKPSLDPTAQKVLFCERCQAFDLDGFLPDIGKLDRDDTAAEPWKSWSAETSLKDTSKAFWLGTVGEVSGRAGSCELCAFALDCDCAFWETAEPKASAGGSTLKETIVNPKSLSDEVLLCIFRWPSTGVHQPNEFGFDSSRDYGGCVFVGAASVQVAEVSESDLQKCFGMANNSFTQNDALRIRRSNIDEVNCGGSFASMDWVVAKLNNCLSSHPNCDAQYRTYGNPEAVVNLLSIIRLVDVNRRRVVQGLGLVSYATLSYVWGSSASPNHWMLSSSSARRRGIRRSLVYKLPKVLPSTIEDAMKVTKLLGYDYLWADSLCIIQDSDEDKKVQIESMASIYANAAVCIIDATGASANHGLSGISVKRAHSIATMSSTTTLRHDNHIMRSISERSPWLTRGWTFQERLLSRRCMIFYEREVCFVCNYGTDQEVSTFLSGEPSAFDTEKNSKWPSLNTGRDFERYSPKWEDENFTNSWRPSVGGYYDILAIYQQAILSYSYRQLTYETDLLNAFSAVASIIASTTASPVRFAVPERGMHRFLLWKPVKGTRRTEDCIVDLPLTEDHGFGNKENALKRGRLPSWSWMSWKGPVTYPLPYDSTMLGTQPLILDPCSIAKLGLNSIKTSNKGLEIITKPSLLMLTKMAWLTLETGADDADSIPSGTFINPETGTKSFPIPTKWPVDEDLFGAPRTEERVSERTCTIESRESVTGKPITGAFIQLGALQQTGSSFRDSNRNRYGYEDECYLLLVDADPLPFEMLAAHPHVREVIQKLMKNTEARQTYLSDKTAYVDPLTDYIQRPTPNIREHSGSDISIHINATYEEDAVFIAQRKGIGHIPESAWRAANLKDVLIFLT